MIGDGGNGGGGGGIYNTGSLTLSDDTISGNTTGAGGNGGGDTVTATGAPDTLVIGSGNGGDGGGTYNGIYNTASLTLTDDTVSGDTTGAGGATGGDDVTATGVGDTFNLTQGTGGEGGGIDDDGTATITATTVSADSAGNGGDISLEGNALTLTDSIVANSPRGGNCSYAGGTLSDGGYNLDSGTTCGLSAATDKNGVDPDLRPLQGNGGLTDTMAPAATSPVIDAIPVGINGCGTTLKADQRGVHRPQGPGCDIGAYETGDVGMQSLSAKPTRVPAGSSLTYTAIVANAEAVDATGVSVLDTLPTAGLTITSARASRGSCAVGVATVTCALGQMPAASTARVTIVVQVTAASGSKLSDTATVSATMGDTNPGNDTKTAKVTVT